MLRPCLGCNRLFPLADLRGSRCDACTRRQSRARNDRRAGSVEVAVYNSAEYKRARAVVMTGAVACAWCGATGVRLVAGHLRPIAEDPEMATDPAGLAPICMSCNNRDAATRRRIPLARRGDGGATRNERPSLASAATSRYPYQGRK
jgi:5-methylcytosine-specific restriction endonuclease McrA